MKSAATNMYKVLAIVLMAMIIAQTSMAQTKTRLKAYYAKDIEGNKVITAVLIKGSGKTMGPVANANVDIISVDEEAENLLATVITNDKGEGILQIEAGYPLPIDEKGYSNLICKFNGNDSLRSSTKKLKFIDLNLQVKTIIEDSVKKVNVFAQRDGIDGPEPVEGVKVTMGVERLYSLLEIEKNTTNADGKIQFIFPDDIPGDTAGSLNVIVKVNDDRKYGTITVKDHVAWGLPVELENTNDRSLFGEQAPLWMIIAVFVILAGAWFNFILAIYKVSKIKKLDPEAQELSSH